MGGIRLAHCYKRLGCLVPLRLDEPPELPVDIAGAHHRPQVPVCERHRVPVVTAKTLLTAGRIERGVIVHKIPAPTKKES